MTRLLHLDSSPRGERSHSRSLTRQFVDLWKAHNPGAEVVYRDLGTDPVPHITEQWVGAAFTPPEQRTAEMAAAIRTSDALVDEFLAADLIVLGAPMYNFNIPSTLKAYIDQIIRVGRTFTMTPEGAYVGLAPGKKVLVITSRGGNYRPGSPAQPFDYQEPFLRTIFGFMGITDVTFIHADSLNFGDEARAQSLAEANAAIGALASKF